MMNAVHYRRRSVAGLDLFYREAGPARAPTLVTWGKGDPVFAAAGAEAAAEIAQHIRGFLGRVGA